MILIVSSKHVVQLCQNTTKIESCSQFDSNCTHSSKNKENCDHLRLSNYENPPIVHLIVKLHDLV